MSEQIPTVGRIVHYRLSAQDAEQVMRRRTNGNSIADRIQKQIVDQDGGFNSAWPLGAQAHIGNNVKEGDSFPMLIVRCLGDAPSSCVNGQVFLDGNDVLWATSVSVGEGPHSWSWPVRG